jgi:hypothetical protein
VYQTQTIAMIKYRKSLESKMLEIHREDGDWTVEELRKEVAIGLKALEDGRYTDYDAASLASFFDGIKKFDAEVWDRQFEEDVATGRLNALAKRALKHLSAGRCTDL